MCTKHSKYKNENAAPRTMSRDEFADKRRILRAVTVQAVSERAFLNSRHTVTF
jgi:hypothetical protein